MGDWQEVVNLSGDIPEEWSQEGDLDDVNEAIANDEAYMRDGEFMHAFDAAMHLLIPDVSPELVRDAEALIRNYAAATEKDRLHLDCLFWNYAAASEKGRESVSAVAEMAAKLGKNWLTGRTEIEAKIDAKLDRPWLTRL